MRKFIFTFLFVNFIWIHGWACSCIYAGDFCEVLPSAIVNESLVVRGTPGKIKGHGMVFHVDQVISGSTDTPKKITVWGDPGYLCRSYVTRFRKSDELLLILHPITEDRVESSTGFEEKNGDYSISGCGEFFIYLNGEQAQSPNCVNLSSNKPSLIKTYPNPVKERFFFEVDEEEVLEINVFATNGALVFKREQLTIHENKNYIQIETIDWVAGIYLVEIHTRIGRKLAKVIKF